MIWAEDLPVTRSEYQNQLIKEALHKKLYEDRYWRILLHYKKTFFGNWESEADAKFFFNSPHGKYDPKAELVETIKAFFSKPDIINQEIPPPQCRFIARYHWLDQFLHFDPAKMKKQACPLFDEWFAMMDPKSISLIFPSYDLFSPGSMFGHTLLRINSVGNENTSILNYAINYGAVIPEAEENTAIYALRGVFGGYRGYFSSVPYYKKVWEYSDMDFRDIWEFDLFLSRHELERMLRHVWELFFTNFDYYFFKENCSYHLLSLIEAARPDLDLQNNYFLWVIPTDTIRDVVSKPNLKTQKLRQLLDA